MDDERDMQDAAEHQQQLDEQRQRELRNCANRGRCWLPSDDLPPVEDLQVTPIDWSEPF